MDASQFRASNNVEDRRRQVYHPVPGVFGDGNVPNVFDVGDGTMVTLDPTKDFVPQPKVTPQLSKALGAEDLDAYARLRGIPMGALDAQQGVVNGD